MENLYRFDHENSNSDGLVGFGNFTKTNDFHGTVGSILQFEPGEAVLSESEMTDLIKSQISNHPLYPNLVSAYINCRKVGAPPEVASFLDGISQENRRTSAPVDVGADPELDDFMESFCEVLRRYKEELSRPFDEARNFLNNIETQLSDLCEGSLTAEMLNSGNYHSDEAGRSSEEELSGEVEASSECRESFGGRLGDQELKEMLLRKYSGYLSSLRKEFLKKRKKGKLPKDARTTLLEWWKAHYRWPYPTEEEKLMLSEVTGLDQKQINNWFINQRKRHWKPSEDMRFALMDGVGRSFGVPVYFDAGSGTGNGTGTGTGTDDI